MLSECKRCFKEFYRMDCQKTKLNVSLISLVEDIRV
jgi:hypothetical protein